MINLSLQRAHSTPPNVSNVDISHTSRDNVMFSRLPPQSWNNPYMNTLMHLNDSAHVNEYNMPWITQNRQNPIHNRCSKKAPLIPPYPTDHGNFNNHFLPNICSQTALNDPMGNQTVMSAPPNNASIGNQLGTVFNNCIPSNLLNNQSMPNNMNANSMLNLPHPSMHNAHTIAMHSISTGSTQPLTGQNTALNNQVPPGNRANNYWDNFRR